MSGEVFLVLALVLPMAGILLAFLGGGRHARGISLVFLTAGLGVAGAITAGVWQAGDALTYSSGGWEPPLGIKLRADGLSAMMLLVTAIVILAAGLYAPQEFRASGGKLESRKSLSFWVLLLSIWLAMNAVFLGNDLFNLYVALELVTFAAVPLVCLSGSPATLQAALRYLIFALIGSALYLLGAVLIYGGYGTLDITLLREKVQAGPLLWAAVAFMTAGLAAKTALFPLHIWLPPAHSGAPPAASALLSALVVKASFFVAVRLWFDVVPGMSGFAAGQVPGAMGAGAIVFGSVLALRQSGLKMLVAYSTVAQIGYLFLMFPLAESSPLALPGGMYQAISHAFAKAAMFLAAGLIVEALGHDRIKELRGMGREMPVAFLAFGIGALSLLGVPPSGGFVAKWLLLTSAATTGQWWWVAVMTIGTLLAGGYVFRVVAPALAEPARPLARLSPVSRAREGIVLTLALCSVLIGLLPQRPLELLRIGRPSASMEGRAP